MDNLSLIIHQHRSLSIGLLFGFSIFIGCFVFPFFNLTKEWPLFISATNIIVFFLTYNQIGELFGILFRRHSIFNIVFLNIGLAGTGMGCRFLLEFGEISNIYNFTWPNILLHFLAVIAVTSVKFLTIKNNRERTE